MWLAIAIVAVILGVVLWVGVRQLRTPKRQPDDAPKPMRDPALTAFKSGSGGAGG